MIHRLSQSRGEIMNISLGCCHTQSAGPEKHMEAVVLETKCIFNLEAQPWLILQEQSLRASCQISASVISAQHIHIVELTLRAL